MDVSQIIFGLTALLIIFSALRVVTTRNMVHAALWLIVTLFGVTVLYALLQANFLAVVQVVVYVGAIAILFIFAIMLTRREMRDSGPQLNRGWPLAALISLVVLGGLLALLYNAPISGRLAADISGQDTLGALGQALVSPDAYVLPFEVASVLLLAALIGAVYVALNKKQESDQ
jgi:NADH-quinone oxidoreductase subunit J